MTYGIFIQTDKNEVEPEFQGNDGFVQNDPDWVYPYPAQDWAYASLTKKVSYLRGTGNKPNIQSLILKDSEGNELGKVAVKLLA